MRFIMMMSFKTDKESMAKSLMNWPKEDIHAHIRFMVSLNKKLKEAGEFVAADGLGWPDQAKLVRVDKDGQPVTDGVFPESKEFLIGYWIIDVESAERAYQVAAEASAAPGPGGVPLNMPIEVRQIMSGPPDGSAKPKSPQKPTAMKYMLLMAGTKADFDWYSKWPQADLERHGAFMRKLSNELKEEGTFVATEGLAWPSEAKIVRAAGDGSPVTDGVFPESKEFLAGYWIVAVESPEEAYRVAARLSAQPAPDRAGAPIEVRQIMGGPPEDFQ